MYVNGEVTDVGTVVNDDGNFTTVIVGIALGIIAALVAGAGLALIVMIHLRRKKRGEKTQLFLDTSLSSRVRWAVQTGVPNVCPFCSIVYLLLTQPWVSPLTLLSTVNLCCWVVFIYHMYPFKPTSRIVYQQCFRGIAWAAPPISPRQATTDEVRRQSSI